MLSCRFQQCLRLFTVMLFSIGLLKRDFFDICLTTYFAVSNFGNTSAMGVIFYFKMFKIQSTFKKCRKKLIEKKFFCFLDNCIWICWIKLSLLRREYLSSAVIKLTNSLKNLHITRRGETFSNSTSFIFINKYCKGAVVQISTVFGTIYHVACCRLFWNGTF